MLDRYIDPPVRHGACRGGRWGTLPSGHARGRVIGMATGETGFGDVMYDLISVQYHSLKAGHDYGQYVRDAENGGYNDVADFFKQVMEEDSRRAAKCHEFLRQLADTEDTGKS